MTRRTAAERVATWIGRVVGLLAVAYTTLGAWLLLGRPTVPGSNGYLVGSLASVVLLLGVAYLLAERTPRPGDGGRSA